MSQKRISLFFLAWRQLFIVLFFLLFLVSGKSYSGQVVVGLTGQFDHYYNFKDYIDFGKGMAFDVGYKLSPNWKGDIRFEKNCIQSTEIFKLEFEGFFGSPEEDGFSRKSINSGLTYSFVGWKFEPFIRGGFGVSDYDYKHEILWQDSEGVWLTCSLSTGGRFFLSEAIAVKVGLEANVDFGENNTPYLFRAFLGLEYSLPFGD